MTEDLISRQAVLDALHARFGVDFDWGKWWNSTHVLAAIESVPSVTPQEKMGRWINVNKGKWNTIPAYKCSECEANADLSDWSGKSPFCPWCGAKMVEPQESEDA